MRWLHTIKQHVIIVQEKIQTIKEASANTIPHIVEQAPLRLKFCIQQELLRFTLSTPSSHPLFRLRFLVPYKNVMHCLVACTVILDTSQHHRRIPGCNEPKGLGHLCKYNIEKGAREARARTRGYISSGGCKISRKEWTKE
jgi:hypothetical protein